MTNAEPRLSDNPAVARLRGATLFSGIGAPECAAPFIDWRWSAEIDPFASAVHAARFPNVPNLGDVTEIDPDAVEAVDLIVFGSPCQDFSVAGLRKGMDGERGNLTLAALALVRQLRPRWLVFENVPGLLSNWSGEAPSDLAEGEEREADQYSDFAAFLSSVRECGYLGCWRVYDAQFAGVPQRRRRIFFVGHLGDWRAAAAVLFEPESLRGDPAPRREAGERIAASLTRGVDSGGKGGYAGRRREDDTNLVANPLGAKRDGGWRGDLDNDTYAIAFDARQSDVLQYGDKTGPIDTDPWTTGICHSLRADGFDASEDGTGRGTPIIPILEVGKGSSSRGEGPNGAGFGSDGDPMFTLQSGAQHAVAFQEAQTGVREYADSGSLRANGPGHDPVGTRIREGMSVRRLTPRECERLQGFPDNWTAITYRGKPAADGPRYRALGNSMAVPVLCWILRRVSLATATASGHGDERSNTEMPLRPTESTTATAQDG